MSSRAFVAIGSNLGDRLLYCHLAIKALAELPHTRLEKVSPIIETEPAEGAGGGRFLNAVAQIATELTPEELLANLRAVESDLGREADHPTLAPRTIDLDILLFDALIVERPHLTIPHPRMASRRFVIEPLAAIAPEVRHPLLGCTIRELLRRLEAESPAPGAGSPTGT
jgi:2-amino-4-hydroxy-6-hydroxymethyldihydropteridine diphosphokinase